jgi:hypothetical protein
MNKKQPRKRSNDAAKRRKPAPQQEHLKKTSDDSFGFMTPQSEAFGDIESPIPGWKDGRPAKNI